MTSQELSVELADLRLERVAYRRLWRRWGFASFIISVLLCAVALTRVAITGEDPPFPMLFLVLTYLFAGLAFTSIGRVAGLRRS
jgi:hypothetical protein